MNTRVLAPLVGIVAFIIRFLRIGAIENDHYVYLARAHQVLHGDWPVRDFADPGMPLAYLLSAAAAAVAGPTLLTEAVVSTTLFAVAAGVTFALARRASGSIALGLVAVALVLLVPPRLYNSSKILVPLAAMLLAWHYADRPSTSRLSLLGAWTGVAFLFRHDYAVYCGAASIVFLLIQHWREWKTLLATIPLYIGTAALVVAPWLIYVELEQGLAEYVAAAIRFSVAERDRTVAQWPFVFYLTVAVPLLAWAVAWRGTRYLAASHVAFATVLVATSEVVLLRDEPAARLPDIVATTAVVLAVVVGRLVPPRTRRPDATPPILLTAALVTAVGILLIVGRSSVAAVVPDVRQRWTQVTTRLRSASPEIMPDPHRAALVRFIERCAAPTERVLIGGFGPELPVLAGRAFAGGLPDWIRGYYEHPDDVARARAQLAREHVALAVMLDGGAAFTAAWPAIAADLRRLGLTRYDVPLATGPVEVWLRPSTLLDEPNPLPCAR